MSPEPWTDARNRLTAAALGYPIEWPNEAFAAPEFSTWLSIEAEGDILQPIELGNGAYEERGVFIVHVIVPLGTGSADARQVAKNIANIYRGVNGFTTYTRAVIGSGSPSEDGKWWVLTVNVDWNYTDRPA
jgi:hypothetical protein